ncbi:MAG: hypothetical protein ABTQ34_04385 [Bdellovibrionales bacterium]
MTRSASSEEACQYVYTFWHSSTHQERQQYLERTLPDLVRSLATEELGCAHVKYETVLRSGFVGIQCQSPDSSEIEKIRESLENDPICMEQFVVERALQGDKAYRKAWVTAAKEILNKKKFIYRYDRELKGNGKKSKRAKFVFSRESHAQEFIAMTNPNGHASLIDALAMQKLSAGAPHARKSPRKPHKSRMGATRRAPAV